MRYLVSGYYGEGNVGDEAILAGMIEAVREQDESAHFTVLSFDPGDTRTRHERYGVEALPTTLRDPTGLFEVLRRADVLLSGGGSFLHEADFALYGRSFLFRRGKLRPVPYFLSVILLARAAGCPVMWYAQGLGPLHTAAARRAVALAGSLSQAVTWRDRESAALAAEIGMAGPTHLVVPDPAYALRPVPPEEAAELLAGRAVPGGGPAGGLGAGGGGRPGPEPDRFVAVSLRPWLRWTAYRENALRALARTAEEWGLDLVFVPMQERTDGPLCRELAARPEVAGRAWVLEGVEDPAGIAGVFGLSACAVTMRLHAGILAAVGGTPAVPIGYDPKVRAFARQTRQDERLVSVGELGGPAGEDRLAAGLARLLGAREAEAKVVAGRAAELGRETRRTARLAAELARSGAVRSPLSTNPGSDQV